MINLVMHSQPDDETCGPTSLYALYHFYNDPISFKEVLKTVKRVKTGGTLSANLAYHALKRGYHATTYVYNLNIFDLSWFDRETGKADSKLLITKLAKQKKYFTNRRDIETTNAYIRMLKHGGEICFQDLNVQLLSNLLKKEQPIITGLSATYLYQTPREWTNRKKISVYDDIRGDPCGHFVVLCGLDQSQRRCIVADPLHTNPISGTNYYKVSRSRLINSIMLGVLTYDSNLLMITPKGKQ